MNDAGNGKEQEVNQLLRWAIDAVDLTVTIDASGIIRHIGKTYAQVLGMEPSEIIGNPVTQIIPGTRMLNVLKTGQPEYGSIFVMKNGTPIIVNRYPIRDDRGNICGAVCVTSFSDLSTANKLGETIRKLQQENELYRTQLDALTNRSFSIDSIIGVSPAMQQLKATIERVANSDLTVLITGKTGTGKEVIADAIHQLSTRRYGKFIKINCAAIPKDLLESELFGYSEGAFSGASKGGKPGKFELSNGGTLLLDEIGELPLQLQSKLLRVLQEHEVERVGGVKPVQFNARVICSTNRDLVRMVAEGTFRQDLYYRINVVELYVPPLRKRKEDLPDLCSALIAKINHYHGCAATGLNEHVLRLFERYDWPGNVRELEHVLERACVLSPAGELSLEDFNFFLPRVERGENTPPDPGGTTARQSGNRDSLYTQKQEAERTAIVNTLAQTGGNKTRAAKLLGIPRSLLYEKIKRYQIL